MLFTKFWVPFTVKWAVSGQKNGPPCQEVSQNFQARNSSSTAQKSSVMSQATATGHDVTLWSRIQAENEAQHRVSPNREPAAGGGAQPRYLQIHFYDRELEARVNMFEGLHPEVMQQLQDMLHAYNTRLRSWCSKTDTS